MTQFMLRSGGGGNVVCPRVSNVSCVYVCVHAAVHVCIFSILVCVYVCNVYVCNYVVVSKEAFIEATGWSSSNPACKFKRSKSGYPKLTMKVWDLEPYCRFEVTAGPGTIHKLYYNSTTMKLFPVLVLMCPTMLRRESMGADGAYKEQGYKLRGRPISFGMERPKGKS